MVLKYEFYSSSFLGMDITEKTKNMEIDTSYMESVFTNIAI